MDSQSTMFEIASGSGSTSSDSIVNICPSGASSICTSSPSTTTNTTTTTTTTVNEDQLAAEVSKLREDKKVLEGRIRGFKTLSDLLVDCRKENDDLKAQVRALSTSLQNKPSMAAEHLPSASSPFSLVSLQVAQQQSQNSGTMSQPNDSQLTLQDQKPPSLDPLTRSTPVFDPKGPPVSYPPATGPPTSLQETVGPPGDSKEPKLISLTAMTEPDPRPASLPPQEESMPKQESLQPESGQGCGASSTPLPGKVCGSESLASQGSTPELLQPDSDKYDEATYEKVGLQLGLGPAGLTSSMYAAGGSPASRPTDFPSLSSELSNGLTQPPSHGSASSPPFMGMLHQSLTGLSLPKPTSDLASEVENITERLHSEPGDSMPAIALQMHQIIERIAKMEQKERDQKKFIETLMRENQELKKHDKVAKSTHQEEIVTLREQNSRLIQQLKAQQPKDHSTAVKLSGPLGDWVHVDKPSHLGENHGELDHSLVDRVRTLEQEKAELQRANSNWKSRWDEMERSRQIKVSELHSKVLLGEQEVAALKARLAEQTTEFECRMLEMKRHIGEEENVREEAQHQQRLAERRCSELQDELVETKTQLSDTAREKQALSAELSILKAHTAGQGTQTGAAGAVSSGSSRAALEAEISMLKEQLRVFAEDFEQERIDRTTAQAARDSAKKSVETMARQSHSLSSQVKHLQKQIKDRDDTIAWTLRQTEMLQHQASDYKTKLAGEWEEKQRLQRRVISLEQQLQQKPQRNPYLSANPATSYNPVSVHQPPPPPRTPVAYFGGQGGAAAPSRTLGVGNVLSPEHLPGAWTCAACTYINYPGRTVCEACGFVSSPRSHPDQYGFPSHDAYGSEHALLMSRGGDQTQGMRLPGTGDLVTDSQS